MSFLTDLIDQDVLTEWQPLIDAGYYRVTQAGKLIRNDKIKDEQTRSGKNGKTFTLYKFRTMVPNAERLKEDLMARNEMSGPVFKINKDPRITRIGSFLRKTSIDELPQFLLKSFAIKSYELRC